MLRWVFFNNSKAGAWETTSKFWISRQLNTDQMCFHLWELQAAWSCHQDKRFATHCTYDLHFNTQSSLCCHDFKNLSSLTWGQLYHFSLSGITMEGKIESSKTDCELFKYTAIKMCSREARAVQVEESLVMVWLLLLCAHMLFENPASLY